MAVKRRVVGINFQAPMLSKLEKLARAEGKNRSQMVNALIEREGVERVVPEVRVDGRLFVPERGKS